MKRFVSLLIALMVIFSMNAMAEGNVSLTTGLPTEAEDQKIIAVSIDNVGQGRPQRNMDCADVVYEIEIARGGYTRYLAIFNDNIPEIVEAVRSTRYIHIDLTSDWNAAFAHCGGASAATYNMYDYLKQFTFPGRFDYYKGDSHFYRDEKRAMPHNAVFKIQSAMEKVDTSVIAPRSPLSFSADNYTQRGEDCSSFKVKYNASITYPGYEYNSQDGLYYRTYLGQPHYDANGNQYACTNVIIMQMDFQGYRDNNGDRPVYTSYGSNKCDYFIRGRHFTGTWYRPDSSSATVYYDDDGNVVNFKPGKTFVQIVRNDTQLELGE